MLFAPVLVTTTKGTGSNGRVFLVSKRADACKNSWWCRLQTYTAPATGNYVFTVAGGQGGTAGRAGSAPTAVGGLGAVVRAIVFLPLGATVPIIVAGQGINSDDRNYYGSDGSGGGGLSAVYTAGANTPTIVAGMVSVLLLNNICLHMRSRMGLCSKAWL